MKRPVRVYVSSTLTGLVSHLESIMHFDGSDYVCDSLVARVVRSDATLPGQSFLSLLLLPIIPLLFFFLLAYRQRNIYYFRRPRFFCARPQSVT
jgi:hypothetical protein